ncbi:MAG TPA: YraN family protein [Thermomicrobiales bacterium]|nr:YraN family protein [Thermomicrobiales bacterium]
MPHDPTPRRALGTAGEGHALRFLEAKGYEVLVRQWRGDGGELDLVLRDGEELVAVEVKTRRGEGYGRAAESVTPRQSRTLLRAMAAFVADHVPPDQPEPVWRVDLVAVTLDRTGRVVDVSHVENAFVADG